MKSENILRKFKKDKLRILSIYRGQARMRGETTIGKKRKKEAKNRNQI